MNNRLNQGRWVICGALLIQLSLGAIYAWSVFAKALQDMARESTVVVVTHSPVLLAACGSLLVLDSGRVALAGPAPAVLQQLQPPPRQLSPSPQSAAEPPRRAKRAKRAPARTGKKSA